VINSKSNIKGELGGINPGNPLIPYALSGGMMIFARSPSSNPGITYSNQNHIMTDTINLTTLTCSAPNLNLNGFARSREESN